MDKDEFGYLYSRLDDHSRRADRGEIAVSGFLSPRELRFGCEYLTAGRKSFVVFGGYEGAERCRIYQIPEYMEGVNSPKELLTYGVDTEIEVIRIIGSGYRVFTHRDFLGSLLALGLERAVLGDIVVNNDGYSAYVFCDRKISEFIIGECERIGNDKVRCERTSVDSDFSVRRKTEAISDTVSSPRLDCIVGALVSVSREKAKEIVLNGYCEVDFETEQRCDRMIRAESLISIRGHGRFRIISVDEKTKKGRIRLLAEKFI
jgi:RNA-binding protein YlmH